MIVEGLLRLVALVMSGLDALVPSFDLPYADDVNDVAQSAGESLAFLSPVLPVGTLATFLVWYAATYMPCAVTFLLVRWAYAHLPVIGRSA